MNSSYKEEHEQFVSDHEGTSLLEVSVVSSIAPLGCLLRNVLLNWLANGRGSVPTWLTFSVDFLTLIMTVLCSFTVLASHLEVYFTCMSAVILCLLMYTEKINSQRNPHVKRNFTLEKLLSKILPGKRPFLSNFRANVNVAAAISILAVDFVIFPRRFCKAETYGSGLMDIGVGAFVLSNAVVSPQARGKHDRSVSSIVRAVKASLPLWVLGLIRLLSVEGIEYHEHTSEYGVHWNFFFTLAVVRVLATAVYCFAPAHVSWALSLVCICSYQYLLDGPLDMKSFVLLGTDGKGSRIGFVNANREGLFSCFGYLAIYFAGVQLGRFLLKPRYFLKDWLAVLAGLCAAQLFFCAAVLFSQHAIEPISRRLANLPYFLWIMQFNLLMLTGFLVADLAGVVFKESGILIHDAIDAAQQGSFSLLEAMNRNGLFYFLLANLLTGLVNLTVPTIHVTPIAAFTILYMYLLALSLIVTLLHLKNITVKFW